MGTGIRARRRPTWLARLVRRLPWWFWASAVVVLTLAARSWPMELAVGGSVAAGVLVAWWIWRRLRSQPIRDWQDAEVAVAVWLRRRGCRRAEVTPRGADGGIDVMTRELAVQVKHVNRRVGRPTLQQIVGAAITVDRAPAVFSTSGFSGPALEYADEHDVAIFHLYLDGRAEPLNKPARSVG